jgi:ABC-type antimicrobial peptide transport system permease subunit
MIISEGLLLAISGIAIGLGCAWFLSRMLETLVYGIAPRDPLTFMAAPLFLLGIAIVAAWIPARSAARADPLQSLRTE